MKQLNNCEEYEVVIEALTNNNKAEDKVGAKRKLYLNNTGYKAMMEDVTAGNIKVIECGITNHKNLTYTPI